MDLWTLAETYLNDDYEKYGVRLGKNWTVVDIGAAFGDFSIFAAQKSLKNKIYAIEPLPSSLNLFNQNIKNNHLKNIQIFPGAISSTKNKIFISEDNKNYGHSQTSTKSPLTTSAISLNNLFIKYQISHCDLIKCDCEGSEYDIFLHLSSSTYQKIDRLVMEYHLFTPDSFKQFKQLCFTLRKNKFYLKLSPNPVHSNIAFLYAFK
jgi:FkbM family methyltransferase